MIQHCASILRALNAHVAPSFGWTVLLTAVNPDTCRVSLTHISVPTRGVWVHSASAGPLSCQLSTSHPDSSALMPSS